MAYRDDWFPAYALESVESGATVSLGNRLSKNGYRGPSKRRISTYKPHAGSLDPVSSTTPRPIKIEMPNATESNATRDLSEFLPSIFPDVPGVH